MLSIFSKIANKDRMKGEDSIELELKQIESELPSTEQMANVCERLKRKRRDGKWTKKDQDLWDQHGCR
jgi:hypothetical protein